MQKATTSCSKFSSRLKLFGTRIQHKNGQIFDKYKDDFSFFFFWSSNPRPIAKYFLKYERRHCASTWNVHYLLFWIRQHNIIILNNQLMHLPATEYFILSSNVWNIFKVIIHDDLMKYLWRQIPFIRSLYPIRKSLSSFWKATVTDEFPDDHFSYERKIYDSFLICPQNFAMIKCHFHSINYSNKNYEQSFLSHWSFKIIFMSAYNIRQWVISKRCVCVRTFILPHQVNNYIEYPHFVYTLIMTLMGYIQLNFSPKLLPLSERWL